MGARGVERALLGMALTFVTSCGGVYQRNGGTDGDVDPSGGAASSGGSSGSGAARTPPWLVDLPLEDMFPWFIQEHGGRFRTLQMAQVGVLRSALEGAPIETTISTHNHLEVVSLVQGLRFSARASRDVVLRVSLTSTLDSDYFAARDGGRAWPVALTPLTTDWAKFEVPLTEMQPAEVREPNALPAFTLAFIVEEQSGPIELWLDDVHFL
jgi:hypothetical protein